MLSIAPNTPQEIVIGQPLCFEASAIVSIPQEDLKPLDIPASGTHWTYNSSTLTFQKVSGTNGTFVDCEVVTDSVVYGLQPFYIQGCNSTFTTPGAGNNNVHWYIGTETASGDRYVLEVMKYCNSNTSSCGAASNPGQTWVLTIYSSTNGTLYSRAVNFNEKFFVRSDGKNLYFEHVQGGVLTQDLILPLPATESWRFIAGAAYINNQINCLAVFKGTYQGTVPLIWTTPLGGTLTTGTATNKCFSAGVAGTYQVCVESEFDAAVCVDIVVDALYLSPVDINCGGCVFTNQTVKFQSNGGELGTLEVVDDLDNPVGTVIDSLTWQASSSAMHVTARYTLEASVAECELNVIPTFRVLNVSGGTITGLVPGDTFQLLTNYEVLGGTVRWENLDCNNLVSPSGLLSVPKNYRDSCFGAVDCTIRVLVIDIPGAICPNYEGEDASNSIYEDLKVKINPVYPTPEFGGPTWTKWKPETPDFRVITKTMEGGCSETHIRNKVPVMRWTVTYSGKRYEDINPCDTSCCDDTLGFVGGFDPRFQTAKMLDDFWMLVAGEYGYFTLIDPRTKETWRNVRFENKMDRDHINWVKNQSRTLSLIWNPCCATYPQGGSCVHKTTIDDNIAPTIPQNLAAVPLSWREIEVTWNASVDNVGIKGYALLIDGIEVDVGNIRIYRHKPLEHSTTHSYQVKAYDYSGNFSDWSGEVRATTSFRDIIPPSVPTFFTGEGVNGTSIHLRWVAATDNVAVAGYKLAIDGTRVDVGNVTSYIHTGLNPGEFHIYQIRARDTSNNYSEWSHEITVHTTMSVIDGTANVMEGSDFVVDG